MSTTFKKLPLSAVIFDRSQKGLPDAPIFAQALKRKINTSPKIVHTPGLSIGAQAILARAGQSTPKRLITTPGLSHQSLVHPTAPSLHPAPDLPTQNVSNRIVHTHTVEVTKSISSSVLRADSVRGQTTEFAQSTEYRGVPHKANTVSAFWEDPSLYRWASDTTKLHDHLQQLSSQFAVVVPVIGVPQYPRVNISIAPELLSASHQSGLVDQVILPRYSSSIFDPLEESIVTFRRLLWKARLQIIDHRELLPHYKQRALDQIDVTLSTLEQRVAASKGAAQDKLRSLQEKQQAVLQTLTPSIPDISVQEKLRTSLEDLLSVLRTISLPSVPRLASRLMIAGSLVLMLLTVGPMVVLEAHSWRQRLIWSLSPHADDASSRVQLMGERVTPTPTAIPTPNPAPDKQFQILIPKLGINSKIIANVDPGNEKEYTVALEEGVAHAAGTGLPGEENKENKTIYIFGHSTNGTWNIARYNALFYAIKDLSAGDEFTVWFWGKEYKYRVSGSKVVDADDVTLLEPQTEKDQLVLQTCYPPGTTWKRWVVIAEPVK